jgi:hypothetical protein
LSRGPSGSRTAEARFWFGGGGMNWPEALIESASRARAAKASASRLEDCTVRCASIGSLDWPRSLGRKSASAISQTDLWLAEAHGRKGRSGRGVYLPALEQPCPPDAPPRMVKLRLVKKT